MSNVIKTTTDNTLLTALKNALPFFIVATNDMEYFDDVIEQDNWEQEFDYISSFDALKEAGIDTINLTDMYFHTVSNDAPSDMMFFFDKENIVALKDSVADMLKMIGIHSIESAENFSRNMLALSQKAKSTHDKPSVRLSLPSLAQPDTDGTFGEFDINDTYHLYIQPSANNNNVSVFFDFGQSKEGRISEYVYNVHMELEFDLLEVVKALF